MNRRRLLLVRHAPTAATRRSAFPDDEPLDERGREQAAALAGVLTDAPTVTSPARRARETSELAGLGDAEIDPDLAELRFGAWAGATLEAVHAEDPERLAAWLSSPDAAPPGGESLRELAGRLRRFLDRTSDAGRDLVAITHGGPVKVAVLLALGAPLDAIWRIDVAPCSGTELHPRPDGGWSVVGLNRPLRAEVAV